MKSQPQFVHLHTHSHYSLLDGLSKVKEMVKLAKSYGMPALAVTDHGNMYGAIEFYKTCKDEGIKPIIGVEAYITPGSRFDKRPGIDTTRYHLTLLAKNNTGYKNLIKLVTASYLEGYYYKPRMDKELLREHAEGIIALSGCFGGELSRTIRGGDIDKAREVIREYQDIFGKENYFIEIMHHPGVEGIEEVKKVLVSLARERDIPIVATQDSHYLHTEDKKAHETLLAVQTNADLSSGDRFSMASDDYSFIDAKKAYDFFHDIPEAVENTLKVADMCEITLELGTWTFPKFEIPEGATYDDMLKKIAYEGIETRGVPRTPELIERVEYELKVIRDKGFSPYFLIVGDLIRHARKHNIFTTIRGSVAGSMVTYLVGITNVNPFEYKLPFERFLNPERPSAPDIDMDYADNRRDEMLAYAREKYGEDKVAQIGTFGTMLAKGSVRDVARALGYPYAVGDKIANLIPLGSQGFPMTIDRAIEMTPELGALYKNDASTKEIIDLARRLEGCVRHISVHAAGVVISPTPLSDFVPTQFDPRGGKVITQYDMHGVEDAGLIKFDFLGIRNLAILGDAVRLVREFHGKDIDIENIPLDDKKTFEMLARGETMGLFQLNGAGMTRYLKELEPTSIHDINAMVALYRPGPMESIPSYIERKRDPKKVAYLDPRMEKILDQSYGVITYQDDVMMIAIELAGYSWLDADKLRKAMGKKIPEVMAEQKKKLLEGFVDHGLSPKKADELWHLIEPFASYGFNKAHAASYGRVAYQTAYMKANYPTEYMTAVLSADSGDIEKVAEIITECTRMGIPVLPPSVNESFGDFTVVRKDGEKDQIRFGLYSIKNLGTDISNAIIEEREARGAYASFSDFLERVTHRNLNKKSLEALIMSGAMDHFGERGQLLANMEDALLYNREARDGTKNQDSLFGDLADASVPGFSMKEAAAARPEEKLAWEKELLGLYISGHPLDKFRDRFEKRDTNIKKIKEEELGEGSVSIIAGIIEEAKEIVTRKGDRMAFLKIADFTDRIECVVFPKTFVDHKELLEADKCVVVKGRISNRNGTQSVVVEAMKELI